MGHAKIQTTMIYAKIVEDFQHQRRVWEGNGAASPAPLVANPVCPIEMAA